MLLPRSLIRFLLCRGFMAVQPDRPGGGTATPGSKKKGGAGVMASFFDLEV